MGGVVCMKRCHYSLTTFPRTASYYLSMSSQRVALVTGAAQGIGFGIAERLGADGLTVVIADMRPCPDSLATLRAAGVTCSNVVVNVTNEAQVEAAIAEVIATYGRLDVLVQAAGITGKTGIHCAEVEADNFDLVYAINVKGIFLMCKHAIPHLKKQPFGRIVNIASISGKEGNAGMLAYSTSKAAVIGLTKVIGACAAQGCAPRLTSLAFSTRSSLTHASLPFSQRADRAGKELAETAVTCNCVAPAVVRTPMVAAMPAEQVQYMTDKIPMKRCGRIEEIAALCAFIASEDSSFTTAFCFDATGGRATY